MEKYTKEELIAMADRCYNRCTGCDKCQNFEAVRYHGRCGHRLFQWSNTGCYYSYEFVPSLGNERWCWFDKPKKKDAELDKLMSLLWTNTRIIDSTEQKSR